MVESVLSLFRKDDSIQAQWWPLSTIVGACQRLANFDRSTPLVTGTYRLQFAVDTTLEGLLHPSFIDVVGDAASLEDGSKQVYIRQIKKEAAIYADFSESVPRLPEAAARNASEWMQELRATRLSLKPYMSLESYAMINYWYSTEAESLFGAREGETAREAAQTLQALLKDASKSTERAKELIIGLGKMDSKTYYVDNYDGEPLEMTFDGVRVEKLATAINKRASYLVRAITLMLETDAENELPNFADKCKQALAEVQAITFDTSITSPRMIGEWLRQFRVHRRFPNPLMKEKIGIALFVNHPKAAIAMRDYGNSNIEQLSLESMGDFVHDTLIPKLAAEENVTKERFLKANGLKNVSNDTIHRWLRFLGFRRSVYKKGFYVDVHERPDIVESRINYCLELMKLEVHCAVWVQLTPERVNELKEAKRINPDNPGIPVITAAEGKALLEFHVDDILDSETLPEVVESDDGSKFGGNHSLRLSPPDDDRFMLWGQDEVVSNEKAMNSMAWYGTEGQQALRPKDLGASIMISGIVSREAGWLPMPTFEQLLRINRNREGKTYVATEAAIAVLGSANKRPLTEDDIRCCAFQWHIQPGQNNEGYWTNSHTLVQFENVADIVNVMFPNHKHIICYDHSQGHCAKRKDGLDAARLNLYPGGRQRCLGNHDNNGLRLEVGAVQSSVFHDSDQGPAWMTPEEQADTKYDKTFDGEVVKRTLRSKKEIHAYLRDKLGEASGLPADCSHLSLASLRDVAKKNKLLPMVVEEVKKQKGWVNAPKGALQLCIERGLIDLSNVTKKKKSYYTMDGRKDPRNPGHIIEGTSLRLLLEQCDDFRREVSMLEWVAKQYNWRVLFSPKCHPEIAGVGIEYDWSVAKNKLMRIPLAERKGKDKFLDKVLNVCFDNKATLTKRVVRGCARKARQFVIAYLLLHAIEAAKTEDDGNGGNGNQALTGEVSVETVRSKKSELKFATIHAARKMYKRHRGIAIFNRDADKISFSSSESIAEFMRKANNKK
ncbi:unknown protein [Seminavis robusta]|uniref:Uncharacterized protein n=1 Tax=Seminavis robusta TaxID=568900 RepID=A0A9N8EYB2_9STRA|nr:unknown protein [Seminavis robusta]|eukprot:Sro2461_g328320.1 n/a (1007) ;mRNA; r:7311-10331